MILVQNVEIFTKRHFQGENHVKLIDKKLIKMYINSAVYLISKISAQYATVAAYLAV